IHIGTTTRRHKVSEKGSLHTHKSSPLVRRHALSKHLTHAGAAGTPITSAVVKEPPPCDLSATTPAIAIGLIPANVAAIADMSLRTQGAELSPHAQGAVRPKAIQLHLGYSR